jgi:hypothetical protein
VGAGVGAGGCGVATVQLVEVLDDCFLTYASTLKTWVPFDSDE